MRRLMRKTADFGGSIVGQWKSVPFATSNFLASGAAAPRWILTSGDQTTYRYKELGKSMILQFSLQSTTVSGVAFSLKLKVPNGRTVRDGYVSPIVVGDNGIF